MDCRSVDVLHWDWSREPLMESVKVITLEDDIRPPHTYVFDINQMLSQSHRWYDYRHPCRRVRHHTTVGYLWTAIKAVNGSWCVDYAYVSGRDQTSNDTRVICVVPVILPSPLLVQFNDNDNRLSTTKWRLTIDKLQTNLSSSITYNISVYERIACRVFSSPTIIHLEMAGTPQ